jgi:ABC-type branched-subunit amino acid transport system substrate-binding protein
MRRTLNTAALTILLAIACSQLFVVGGRGARRQSVREADAAAARGRRIYFEGADGTGAEIQVRLGAEEIEAPATAFACVNCHAADGRGTSEGGVNPAPVNWDSLADARRSTLTGRPRPAYDEKTLARAFRAGLNSAGERLHPAMPRYGLTDRQTSDLIAFLRILGTDADADPGLGPDTIKVGAALPLTGQFTEAGAAARATLAAYFAQANGRGGVYGRRFELVVADSAGTAAGTLAATRELLESGQVFALVGSFEPQGGAGEAGEYLRRKGVPLVGPLALSHVQPATPNPSLFYLLPTARDQAAALVEYLRGESERTRGGGRAATRLALLSAVDDFDREAAEGARTQLEGAYTNTGGTRVGSGDAGTRSGETESHSSATESQSDAMESHSVAPESHSVALESHSDASEWHSDASESRSGVRESRSGQAGTGAGGGRGPDEGASARALTLVLDRSHRAGEFAAAEMVSEIKRAGAEVVLFFGGPAEFAALARELERQRVEVWLAALSISVGREALALPPAQAAHTLLAHPTPLPERADFAEFSALLKGEGGGTNQLAFRVVAYAAAKVFTEGVKLGGRRLSRAGLVTSLEQLRDFRTGVLPPLTFGPNRRLGVAGAYVFGVDAAHRRFTPLSDWIDLSTDR